jgi:hypothetical protein
MNAWLDAHRGRVQKLADGRLNLPWREPFMDGHNTWVVNRPGTTFVIPVVDNAEMLLNVLAFLISNGYGLFDDINGRPIPGLEKFGDLIDVDNPWPLSVVEQETLTMADMRAAVEALEERKYGKGGPFNAETPGPFKDGAKVRAAALGFSDEYRDCLTTMAQYIHDTFGTFPGTIPTMYVLTYLQACHLDLDFYDKFLKETGGYLETHARHMERWHSG